MVANQSTPLNWTPFFEYSVANCNHWWSLFPHTTASENSTHGHTALLSVQPRGVTQIMSALFVAVLAVVYCLLYSAPMQQDRSALQGQSLQSWSSEWWSDCKIVLGQENKKQKSKLATGTGGLFQYCEINLLHTHMLTYLSHALHPLLNTDYHPSMMWMLCRPVFKWSSVHPNAATVPICCP